MKAINVLKRYVFACLILTFIGFSLTAYPLSVSSATSHANGSAATTTSTTTVNYVSVTASASPGKWIYISGTISPAPTASQGQSVNILVENPNGTLVLRSGPIAITASGTYSWNYSAGFSSPNWISGTYTVNVVWQATLSQAYSAITTFQFETLAITTTTTNTTTTTTTTSSTSSSGLNTNTLSLASPITETTLSSYKGLQISYSNNYGSTLQAVIFVVIYNSLGQAIGISTGSISIGPGATVNGFVALPTTLASGTYSASVFAVTLNNIPISVTASISITK